MKWIGYIWSFVTNLIALVVTLGILNSGYSQFEKLVLALLMLNYLRLCTVEFYIGDGYRETVVRQNACFIHLSALLKDPQKEDLQTAATELESSFQKLKPKIWITLIFNSLSWLVVVWTIITSL